MKLVTKSLIFALILAATPASAGKADKTAFRIGISMEGPLSEINGVYDLYGEFHAHGAISSAGSASMPFLSSPILLVDDQGSLTVVLTDWTSFQITDATGAYEGLSGGGSISMDFTYLWPKGTTGKDKHYTEPDRARVDLLLEGSLG